jgi:D-arabinose 5-phosphate isomerase GutQ
MSKETTVINTYKHSKDRIVAVCSSRNGEFSDLGITLKPEKELAMMGLMSTQKSITIPFEYLDTLIEVLQNLRDEAKPVEVKTTNQGPYR